LSTPFVDIFNKFLSLIDDGSIFRGLTDGQVTEVLYNYLDNAKIYFKSCKKDLKSYQKFKFHSQTAIADGINKEYLLSNYPTSPSEDSIELVFTIDGISVGHTFDAETLTFTAELLPVVGDEVVFGYNFSGQFEDDFDDEEEWILAHGMVLSWTSQALRSEDNIKNTMTTRDYTSYSPANFINSLMELRNQSKKELEEKTIDYTYNNFNGF